MARRNVRHALSISFRTMNANMIQAQATLMACFAVFPKPAVFLVWSSPGQLATRGLATNLLVISWNTVMEFVATFRPSTTQASASPLSPVSVTSTNLVP